MTCIMMRHCIMSQNFSGHVRSDSFSIISEVFHENQPIISKGFLDKKTAIIKTGIIVSNCIDANGIRSIHDIYFPGNIINHLPKTSQLHPIELKTIETSCLCFFNNELLEQHNALYIRSLKKQLDFFQDSNSFKQKIISQRNPAKRVALFILTIIEKKKFNIFDNIQIKINLTRQQIGIYLGLVEETIVRALRQLCQLELLEVRSKNFIIPKYHKLLDFYNSHNLNSHNKLPSENVLKNNEVV